MRRYLVLANQTLGGQELQDEIERRIEGGPCEFVVAVPVTRVRDLVQMGVPGSGAAFPVDIPAAERDDEAWEQARQRMNHLLGVIRERGVDAFGHLGDADPYHTFKEITENREFDEVIISTLPAGISRWLGMDLPSRIGRAFDGPITTITPED